MNPFTDSRLRTARAAEQFKSLESEVRKWLGRKTYSFTIREDTQTGETVCQVGESESLPANWPIVADEIVHHFRSALDNAIHHLTIAHSGKEVKGTEFPIFVDKQMFENQGKRRISGLILDCQAIIESVQPFNKAQPDTHVLWGIHELANAEKHQTLPLLEVFRKVESATVTPAGAVEAINVKYGQPGPIQSGTEIARWTARATGKGKVDVNFDLARDILLEVSRPPVLNGKPLIHSLYLMGQVTKSVIDMLETSHNKHFSKPLSPDEAAIGAGI